MLEKNLVVNRAYEKRVMKILILFYAALKTMNQEVYGVLRFYICTVYMYLSCVWSCLLISSLTQIN